MRGGPHSISFIIWHQHAWPQNCEVRGGLQFPKSHTHCWQHNPKGGDLAVHAPMFCKNSSESNFCFHNGQARRTRGCCSSSSSSMYLFLFPEIVWEPVSCPKLAGICSSSPMTMIRTTGIGNVQFCIYWYYNSIPCFLSLNIPQPTVCLWPRYPHWTNNGARTKASYVKSYDYCNAGLNRPSPCSHQGNFHASRKSNGLCSWFSSFRFLLPFSPCRKEVSDMTESL